MEGIQSTPARLLGRVVRLNEITWSLQSDPGFRVDIQVIASGFISIAVVVVICQ